MDNSSFVLNKERYALAFIKIMFYGALVATMRRIICVLV